MAQNPSQPDPLPRKPDRRKIRSEKSESEEILQRKLPVWDSEGRESDRDSIVREKAFKGEAPLDEKALFEEELEDLDVSGSERASPREAMASQVSVSELYPGVEKWAAGPGKTGQAASVRPVAPEMDGGVPSPREFPGEDAWTGRHVGSLWWVLAGGLCAAVVGIFLLQSFDTPVRTSSADEPQREKINGDISEIPIADFVVRSSELMPVVMQVLRDAHSAEGQKSAQFLRGGKESLERKRLWEVRKPSVGGYYPVSQLELHAAVLMGHPYLILMGLDKDYVESLAYFSPEADGSFKYDWEASEGYSELLPAEVGSLKGKNPRLMRGIITPSTFYPPAFPEVEFQCYAIHHRDAGDFIWAFARRGSEANKRIRGHFSLPMIPSTRGRVTVKVRRGPDEARANQLELVDFLNSDWMMLEDGP